MKKIIAMLCLAVCLLTAGCNKNPKVPDDTEQKHTDIESGGSDEPGDTSPADSNTESGGSDETGDTSPADSNTESEGTDPSQPFDWDAGLTFIRQIMLDESKSVAVANLGFCGARADVTEFIKNNCKRFDTDRGFLSHIPDERIIGDGGQLFCVLAYETTSAISVNRLNDNGEVTEAAWTGDGSIPLLIFANNGGFEPDMQVAVYTARDETVLNLQTNSLSRAVTTESVLDISNYHDVAEQTYSMASEGAWDKPTKQALVNTSWLASRYVNEYETEQYSLDFFEDTVKIVWNEGIGEFTAKWSLSEKDGITILTLDLENLDGLRNYAVLLSPDMLSITADFTGDSEIRSYEAINTLFEKTLG